jgi:CheY-like chemotaxis protein
MGRRILVVDDDRSAADTSRVILEMNGYTVACAYSGDQAIAKAEDFCPDLLLSDVHMPGLNGFETALQVKRLCPACSLLFVSGFYTKTKFVRLSEGLEIHGYHFELLEKPVLPATLLDKVKAALIEEVDKG